MKVITKLFVFFLFASMTLASCGGSCQTCEMEGETAQEVCQDDIDTEIENGNLSEGTTVDDVTALLETAGYSCS